MDKHLNIRAWGRVQGVFFRQTTRERARKLKLTGFARNEPDGAVYIEVEGREENLQTFLKFCKRGPFLARVKSIETTEGSLKNFFDFHIS
ncbi:hypothetical protein A3I25_02200 [Candidatus Nomurabacteria bacterium RIFCSPLOWO2_02_FULL_42_17]|uniref:acylphosphatase n=1 Tax=Candidatus Nomurabacteria bacterium RIFCSPLOWO2_02_FULL_42_17 TaxID=1801789 RepID=A0A1F6XU03_9BACT|nr:MAG: hypothetical protein A3I25_02200 [Candidatus Nomurabacteria bacterium RIFCSPLOWO2_02_FULL_42_17]